MPVRSQSQRSYTAAAAVGLKSLPEGEKNSTLQTKYKQSPNPLCKATGEEGG